MWHDTSLNQIDGRHCRPHSSSRHVLRFKAEVKCSFRYHVRDVHGSRGSDEFLGERLEDSGVQFGVGSQSADFGPSRAVRFVDGEEALVEGDAFSADLDGFHADVPLGRKLAACGDSGDADGVGDEGGV
ncbi:hypothetical protein ACLOJK_025962 [Asimina triloba]